MPFQFLRSLLVKCDDPGESLWMCVVEHAHPYYDSSATEFPNLEGD